jgi:hypothetical protein
LLMEKRLFKLSTSIKNGRKIYIFPESGSEKIFQASAMAYWSQRSRVQILLGTKFFCTK